METTKTSCKTIKKQSNLINAECSSYIDSTKKVTEALKFVKNSKLVPLSVQQLVSAIFSGENNHTSGDEKCSFKQIRANSIEATNIKSRILLIDCRKVSDFESGHIVKAQNFDISSVQKLKNQNIGKFPSSRKSPGIETISNKKKKKNNISDLKSNAINTLKVSKTLDILKTGKVTQIYLYNNSGKITDNFETLDNINKCNKINEVSLLCTIQAILEYNIDNLEIFYLDTSYKNFATLYPHFTISNLDSPIYTITPLNLYTNATNYIKTPIFNSEQFGNKIQSNINLINQIPTQNFFKCFSNNVQSDSSDSSTTSGVYSKSSCEISPDLLAGTSGLAKYNYTEQQYLITPHIVQMDDKNLPICVNETEILAKKSQNSPLTKKNSKNILKTQSNLNSKIPIKSLDIASIPNNITNPGNQRQQTTVKIIPLDEKSIEEHVNNLKLSSNSNKNNNKKNLRLQFPPRNSDPKLIISNSVPNSPSNQNNENNLNLIPCLNIPKTSDSILKSPKCVARTKLAARRGSACLSLPAQVNKKISNLNTINDNICSNLDLNFEGVQKCTNLNKNYENNLDQKLTANSDLNSTNNGITNNTNSLPTYEKGDIAEITPYLFLGSAHHRLQTEKLIKIGITAIINCQTKPTDSENFKVKNICIEDNNLTDIKGFFKPSIEYINEEYNKHKGKILVYCRAGISRSATICIAYLLNTYNINLNTAMNYIKSKRKEIDPNFGFMGQLINFEKELNLSSNVRETFQENNLKRLSPKLFDGNFRYPNCNGPPSNTLLPPSPNYQLVGKTNFAPKFFPNDM